MIASEDTVFYKKMHTMMLDLAVICLRLQKKFDDAKYGLEYEFYYQQAKQYKRLLNGVK